MGSLRYFFDGRGLLWMQVRCSGCSAWVTIKAAGVVKKVPDSLCRGCRGKHDGVAQGAEDGVGDDRGGD